MADKKVIGGNKSFEMTSPDEVGGLKNQVASLNETVNGLTGIVNTLANSTKSILEQNQKIIDDTKKTQENQELANYADKFKLSNEVKTKILGSVDSSSDKKDMIMNAALEQMGNITKALSGKALGNLSTEELIGDNKGPKNIDEAMSLAEKEKPELTGKDLTNYCERKYPKVFNLKGQFDNIKKSMAEFGQEV